MPSLRRYILQLLDSCIELETAIWHSITALKTWQRSKLFLALEKYDKDALVPLLAPEVVKIIPFSNTGAPEPWREFKGKEALLGYLNTIIDNFTRNVWLDKQFYISDDGSTVFMEGKGDLVYGATSAPYNNVYIFKFIFEGGKVLHISEYANPVLISKLMGLPLG